jgi:hypothetical protein
MIDKCPQFSISLILAFISLLRIVLLYTRLIHWHVTLVAILFPESPCSCLMTVRYMIS